MFQLFPVLQNLAEKAKKGEQVKVYFAGVGRGNDVITAQTLFPNIEFHASNSRYGELYDEQGIEDYYKYMDGASDERIKALRKIRDNGRLHIVDFNNQNFPSDIKFDAIVLGRAVVPYFRDPIALFNRFLEKNIKDEGHLFAYIPTVALSIVPVNGIGDIFSLFEKISLQNDDFSILHQSQKDTGFSFLLKKGQRYKIPLILNDTFKRDFVVGRDTHPHAYDTSYAIRNNGSPKQLKVFTAIDAEPEVSSALRDRAYDLITRPVLRTQEARELNRLMRKLEFKDKPEALNWFVFSYLCYSYAGFIRSYIYRDGPVKKDLLGYLEEIMSIVRPVPELNNKIVSLVDEFHDGDLSELEIQDIYSIFSTFSKYLFSYGVRNGVDYKFIDPIADIMELKGAYRKEVLTILIKEFKNGRWPGEASSALNKDENKIRPSIKIVAAVLLTAIMGFVSIVVKSSGVLDKDESKIDSEGVSLRDNITKKENNRSAKLAKRLAKYRKFTKMITP